MRLCVCIAANKDTACENNTPAKPDVFIQWTPSVLHYCNSLFQCRISFFHFSSWDIWDTFPSLATSFPFLSPGSIQCIFEKSNNHYSWKKVTTTVHNIIVGKLWIDQVMPKCFSLNIMKTLDVFIWCFDFNLLENKTRRTFSFFILSCASRER